MATAKHTTIQAVQTEPAQVADLLPMAGTLRLLYESAKDNMSADELEYMGNALTENAADHARRMSTVAEGVACLIDSDTRSGALQSKNELFALLCVLSHEFNAISGMVDVGTEATWKANEMRGARS